MFGRAEKAGAHFPIGREAQAVAVAAERLGNRSNDADLAAASGEAPAFSRFGFVPAFNGKEFEALLNSMENFLAGDHQFFEPHPGGIQWHEFDEAHAQRAIAAKFGQSLDLMVIDSTNYH